jgi:glucosamine--fructose-6-phosphate aminotransferase (isomerizing)
VALAQLVLVLAEHCPAAHMEPEVRRNWVRGLRELPEQLRAMLALDEVVLQATQLLVEKQHALFLGRAMHFPIALEGALKLKEISYIHAEAYPSGELKHGPLALVDTEMPVIAVAPRDDQIEKPASNLQEVRERDDGVTLLGPAPQSPGRESPKVLCVRSGPVTLDIRLLSDY